MKPLLQRLLLPLTLLSSCAAGSTTVNCSTVTDTCANASADFFSTHCTTCPEHASDFATQRAELRHLDRIGSLLSSGELPRCRPAKARAWRGCRVARRDVGSRA